MRFVNRQSGFTLLEVLVTLIILAIGLLGLLNLQIVSLKNNHSALHRTVAIMHAYDILDRIRLNRTANYTVGFDTVISGTDLANQDLTEWKSNLSVDLPEGNGAITINGDMVDIQVRWNDQRGTSGDNRQTFTVSSQR
jgi:type IV pilus assembly protein PilV